MRLSKIASFLTALALVSLLLGFGIACTQVALTETEPGFLPLFGGVGLASCIGAVALLAHSFNEIWLRS